MHLLTTWAIPLTRDESICTPSSIPPSSILEMTLTMAVRVPGSDPGPSVATPCTCTGSSTVLPRVSPNLIHIITKVVRIHLVARSTCSSVAMETGLARARVRTRGVPTHSISVTSTCRAFVHIAAGSTISLKSWFACARE